MKGWCIVARNEADLIYPAWSYVFFDNNMAQGDLFLITYTSIYYLLNNNKSHV